MTKNWLEMKDAPDDGKPFLVYYLEFMAEWARPHICYAIIEYDLLEGGGYLMSETYEEIEFTPLGWQEIVEPNLEHLGYKEQI